MTYGEAWKATFKNLNDVGKAYYYEEGRIKDKERNSKERREDKKDQIILK